MYTSKQIAGYIDQTLLKPDATPAQLIAFCEEAKAFPFASVCVQPGYVPLAAECMAGTGIKIAAVVGFPHGANDTKIKAAEAALAVEQGAMEIDMVLPIGRLIAGQRDAVRQDIDQVDRAAKAVNPDCITKVIFENCLLTKEQIALACEIALETGVDFVKTSTGFAGGGATREDVALMKQVVGDKKQVKAAGGVRNLDDLLAMLELGATRIGTSAGLKLVREALERFGE